MGLQILQPLLGRMAAIRVSHLAILLVLVAAAGHAIVLVLKATSKTAQTHQGKTLAFWVQPPQQQETTRQGALCLHPRLDHGTMAKGQLL